MSHNARTQGPPRFTAARHGATLAVALAAAGSIFYASTLSVVNGAAPARATTSLDCGSLSKLLLAHVGVTPDALAAIGATNEQVESALAVVRSLCDSPSADFDGVQAAVEQAQREYSDLAERARRGSATEADRAALEPARLALADALADRDAVLSNVRDTIENTLSTEQRDQLRNILAAREVEVPIQYKVTQRTPEEWVTLRDQLSEARRLGAAAQRGHAATVNPAESAAADRLASRREAVRALWNQLLSGS